jgi:hypothetical protein
MNAFGIARRVGGRRRAELSRAGLVGGGAPNYRAPGWWAAARRTIARWVGGRRRAEQRL